MAEAEEFDFSSVSHPATARQLDLLFGKRDGYVAIEVGHDPAYVEDEKTSKLVYTHQSQWDPRRYKWPQERTKLLGDVIGLTTSDVYVCPSLRVKPERKGAGQSNGRFLWADLDHNLPLPTWIVANGGGVLLSGSKGNRHVYVPIAITSEGWLDGVELSERNRELAWALKGDAKFNHSSLLRLAGTYNQKGRCPKPGVDEADLPGMGEVRWEVLPDLRKMKPDDTFERLSRVRAKHEGTRGTNVISLGAGIGTSLLPAQVQLALENQDHETEGDSGGHHRLIGACIDGGLTISQTFSVMLQYRPSVRKYGKGERLQAELRRSWDKLVDERQIKKAESQAKKIHEEIVVVVKKHMQQSARDLLKADLPPLKWAIPDLLPEGLGFIVGEPKAGKSFFVLNLCMSLVSGQPVLGKIPIKKFNVLYAALEDSERRLQDRMNRFLDGQPYGDDWMDIHIWTQWHQHDEDGVLLKSGEERLIEYLEANSETRLVILDVYQRVKRKNVKRNDNMYEADYDEMTYWKVLADKYHISLLMVHHTNKSKDTGDSARQVSGSQGIMGGLDLHMHLHRDLDKKTNVPMKTGSLEWRGRDVEPRKIMLEFDSNRQAWEMMESGFALHFPEGSTKRMIANTLAAHAVEGMTPAQMADATDLKRNSANQAMFRMAAEGFLRKAKASGKYFLADEYQDEALTAEVALLDDVEDLDD